MLEYLKGKRVYFDTNPIIYFVEGHEIFYSAVKPIFGHALEKLKNMRLINTPITLS